MHPAHLEQLRRKAFTPATSGRTQLERVKALDQLTRLDGRIPVEAVEEVLVDALGNPFGNWEGSRAASIAASLLSYIKECQDGDGMQWPSDHPETIAGPDYWPGRDDLFAQLDQNDTEGDRDRWRTNVFGPPPWKPGQDPLELDAEDAA